MDNGYITVMCVTVKLSDLTGVEITHLSFMWSYWKIHTQIKCVNTNLFKLF